MSPPQEFPIRIGFCMPSESITSKMSFRPPLRVVSGCGAIRGSDAAPCNGVCGKLIGQFWREIIVDVRSEVAAHKQYRPSRAAPIEYFQPDGRIDGDEPHLMRRMIVPGSASLPREQAESDEERYRMAHRVIIAGWKALVPAKRIASN